MKIIEESIISYAEFYCGDAGEFILEQYHENKVFKSSDGTFLGIILKTHPKRVVYVSCNPATFARDLKILSKDYNIKSVTPVDMFPNTIHVESVCLLEKND